MGVKWFSAPWRLISPQDGIFWSDTKTPAPGPEVKFSSLEDRFFGRDLRDGTVREKLLERREREGEVFCFLFTGQTIKRMLLQEVTKTQKMRFTWFFLSQRDVGGCQKWK